MRGKGEGAAGPAGAGAPSPTLKDIAAAAGVHPSTVSRALRQEPPAGGWGETAVRIRELAAMMGYRPNFIAAGLRTRSSRTIGVVMPRLTDGVIAAMCQGIEEAATAAGYQILLATPRDAVEAQLHSVEMLVSRQIDGLIVTSLHLDRADMAERIKAHGVPTLALNRHAEGVLPAVTSDDRQGGYLAVEHLLQLGHRRVGVIAGPRHASTAWGRTLGAMAAMRQHGVDLDEALIVHSEFEVQGGVTAAQQLLDLDDPPTAIFAVNDTAAVGVVGAARDRGLRIPRDLSLVGYNDIPLVAQLPVPLTTVSSPHVALGSVGLQQLLRGIRGEPMASMTLPVSMVVRASTTVPRVE